MRRVDWQDVRYVAGQVLVILLVAFVALAVLALLLVLIPALQNRTWPW